MGIDVAVMTDIHGHFEAFQTCVRYVLERNIRNFIFLGDYVGEFSFPQRTMSLLYELRKNYACTFIKGNKEDYWLDSAKRSNRSGGNMIRQPGRFIIHITI